MCRKKNHSILNLYKSCNACNDFLPFQSIDLHNIIKCMTIQGEALTFHFASKQSNKQIEMYQRTGNWASSYTSTSFSTFCRGLSSNSDKNNNFHLSFSLRWIYEIVCQPLRAVLWHKSWAFSIIIVGRKFSCVMEVVEIDKI